MVCDWPVEYGACTDDGQMTALTGLSTRERDMVEAAATEFLWRWTSRRFGLCPSTVRPCLLSECDGEVPPGRSVYDGLGTGPDRAALWFACGTCAREDCCVPGHGVPLPGPVHSVEQVTIGGAPFTDWVWQPAAGLVRTDGRAWPACQDLTAPGDAPGSWTVSYTRGVPVPPGGRIAAGVLAAELARAWCGDTGCQLPQRVQSITRQGMTATLLDSFDDVTKGRTGIWLVDSWVASVTAPSTGSMVVSPDTGRYRRHARQTVPVGWRTPPWMR